MTQNYPGTQLTRILWRCPSCGDYFPLAKLVLINGEYFCFDCYEKWGKCESYFAVSNVFVFTKPARM